MIERFFENQWTVIIIKIFRFRPRLVQGGEKIFSFRGSLFFPRIAAPKFLPRPVDRSSEVHATTHMGTDSSDRRKSHTRRSRRLNGHSGAPQTRRMSNSPRNWNRLLATTERSLTSRATEGVSQQRSTTLSARTSPRWTAPVAARGIMRRIFFLVWGLSGIFGGSYGRPCRER